MCLPGMATVLKRLLTVCLALAFLLGVTVQLMPPSMAETVTTVSTEMGGCACPYPPCTGHMPNCLDHGGCISVSVLPTTPATIALSVEWTSLDCHLPPKLLAGISVKPELFPPILAT